MRCVAVLSLATAAAAFSGFTSSVLPTSALRLHSASAVTSLRARDCVFDQEPCEASGECRVNNQFCDDNHGFLPAGGRACSRKAALPEPVIKPEVAKIFAEVAAELEKGRQSTK